MTRPRNARQDRGDERERHRWSVGERCVRLGCGQQGSVTFQAGGSEPRGNRGHLSRGEQVQTWGGGT